MHNHAALELSGLSDETQQLDGNEEAETSPQQTTTQPPAKPLAQDSAVQRRRMFTTHLIAFSAVFVAFLYLQTGIFDWTAWVEWLTWRAYSENSIALNEAIAWWSGFLQLPTRLWDTALVPASGEVYNVFPPMQTMLWFICTAIPSWRTDPSSIPGILPFILFGLPLPIVAYTVFANRVKRPMWAGVLTLALLCGTAVAPCFVFTRVSYVFHTAHILSQVGLLLLANEVLGRRRVWLMGLGLAIAVWSRQLAIFYAIAILYAAWKGPIETCNVSDDAEAGSCDHETGTLASNPIATAHKRRMRKRLLGATLAICIVVTVPAGLNWAKFGSPFDTGYPLIYEGRDDPFAFDAQTHGLFGLRYVGRNFTYMNTSIVQIADIEGRRVIIPSRDGTSMWLTTPLLAFAIVGAFKARRESGTWLLMACSLPVLLAILCYHATGAVQVGYYRFALDFIPVWMVAGAVWCVGGWRRYATAICTLWSLGYFAFFTWALL